MFAQKKIAKHFHDFFTQYHEIAKHFHDIFTQYHEIAKNLQKLLLENNHEIVRIMNCEDPQK